MDRLTPLSRRVVSNRRLLWMPGAYGVLSQLIQEAKENKGCLTVVWLDFANIYGSTPHNLILVTLDYYHIPNHMHGMITSYLGDIKPQFQLAMFTTKWCTISPILFIMGMNLIISAVSTKSSEPKEAKSWQPGHSWMTLL